MDTFVGRRDELHACLDLLASPGDGVARDIVGVYGVGKSTFLEHLSDSARKLELAGREVRVFSIDMKRHGLGEGFSPGDLGASASLDMLWEVFTRSRQLMSQVADGQHEFDGFRLTSLDVMRVADSYRAAVDSGRGRSPDISIGRRAQVGTVATYVQHADGAVRQHIRALQSQLDDAFAQAWAQFTARRQVLITIDSFQLVADNELGRWFIQMAMRMPNTLAVLARTPTDRPPQRELASLNQMQLPFFTCDEVAEYLRKRLGLPAGLDDLAAVTHDFTDGHPGGVNLVGDLIVRKGGADLGPSQLRLLLDGLPGQRDQRWAELVVLVLDAVQEPVLQRAVDAAAAATTLDAGLLAELIDRENPQDVAIDRVISALVGLRMLQQVPAMSGGPSDRFRLHEFIRQSVAARLRTYDPATWAELQSVAAQHYFRLLQGWDEDPYDSYGAWYRYEDPRWQEYKREWLRVSGQAADLGPVTRARFTLVFLEAFWWWGVYLPFPFMRRLLEDWNRVSAEWARARTLRPAPLAEPEDNNQLLLDALTQLIRDYPVSYVKPSSAPWDNIRACLIRARSLCGLNPAGGLAPATLRRATAEEKGEITRTGAFITLFLAHTWRFGDHGDASAEKFYETAATAFRELGDEWTSAWIAFERADMALEQRDLERSSTFIAKAAAQAADLAARTCEWDRELLANMYRTWADVCWLSGRLDDAGRGYGRAVANAYWFQGEPQAVDGDPHGPDDYTQHFYSEMTLRAAQRIAELADRPAAMERFGAAVLAEVPRDGPPTAAASLTGADVSAIRDKAFPQGPDDDELLRMESPFMSKWNLLYLEVPDPLAGLSELTQASDDH